MREFIAVSSALVILMMTNCAIREDRSMPKCGWNPPNHPHPTCRE